MARSAGLHNQETRTGPGPGAATGAGSVARPELDRDRHARRLRDAAGEVRPACLRSRFRVEGGAHRIELA